MLGLIGFAVAAFSAISVDFVAGATVLTAGVPFMASFTPAQREELMAFIAANMNFEGDDLYEGSGDDLVDFDGPNGSFLTEASTTYREFTFTISNPSANAKEIMLTPGYMWSPTYIDAMEEMNLWNYAMVIGKEDLGTGVPAADVDYTISVNPKSTYPKSSKGFIKTGAFYAVGEKPTGGVPTLSAAGTPYSIEEFYAFLMYNPTNLLGMRIQSNGGDGAQVAYPLEVISQSPFKQLESKIINPSTSMTQNTYQTDTVVFDTKGIVLSNQTQIKYKIAGNFSGTTRVVNITFVCGSVLNTTVGLQKKQTKAIQNFAGMVKPLQMLNKPLQMLKK